MKILQLHNRYKSQGGEDVVVLQERLILEDLGNDVLVKYFDNSLITGFSGNLLTAFRCFFSIRSFLKIILYIKKINPDIVHIHNIFPLISPSAYYACYIMKVPVVQTIHNYRLICPNALLFRNNAPCELCVGKKYFFDGIRHKCYRSSRYQTAVVAMMTAFHFFAQTWQTKVDRYITLTSFQKKMISKSGIANAKIVIKSNFIQDPLVENFSKPRLSHHYEYLLYVGRLSEEKGVKLLIESYIKSGTKKPLKIIGDGPLKTLITKMVKGASLESSIEILGKLEKFEVITCIRNSQFMVVPSLCYEGFPLTILESFSCGIPVVAPSHGGTAEVVEDGITGKLFEPGSVDDLASKISWLVQHIEECSIMGFNARRVYEEKYTPEQNYENLMRIYEDVIHEKKKSCKS